MSNTSEIPENKLQRPRLMYSPSENELKHSALAKFCVDMHQKYKLNKANFASLHDWSVNRPEKYWQEILYAGNIIYAGAFTTAMKGNRFFETEWFPGLTFNYAENMLCRADENLTALLSVRENGTACSWTFGDLKQAVAKMAALYQTAGVIKGDRIAAVMPNSDFTVICSLAAASLGAIWASTSPDVGKEGILDRFAQIDPKVLISIDAYNYNGKNHNILPKIKQAKESLPALAYHIEFNFEGDAAEKSEADVYLQTDDILKLPGPVQFKFKRVPFSHPLYILFSSGTTGMPKCITHSHGGVLFQHKSEMLMHCDVRKGDRMFFYTTCGWMMWNWMISALGQGATVITFDGSPGYKHRHYLWELANRLKVTHLGMGAKYVSICAQDIDMPDMPLSDLRAIFTTGSPLTNDLFDYLGKLTRNQIRISSISGGTDIVACFVGGNPILPVYRGEIQCRMLGMDVHALNESGASVLDEKGEMVCLKPFPSAPVCFQNDPDNQKYKQAYFNTYPNIWAHGDYISISSKTGGVVIYGRSDTTLNPGGVRIGAAEIYRYVEDMKEISEAIVIGRSTGDDEEIVLFVVMAKDQSFDQNTVNAIKHTLRSKTTPRHVPAKIFPVSDIPKTLNGKKMEKLLKNLFSGKPNDNLSAMENPQCLKEFETIKINQFDKS